MIKLRWLYYCLGIHLLAHTTPVVDIYFNGMLGNNLWQYCIGKIIAEELGYKCHCNAIYGFPTTYSCHANMPSSRYSTERIQVDFDINIPQIISNRTPRNIFLEGYFQRYAFIKNYAEKIRKDWLKIENNLLQIPQDPDDIVIHIRASNYPGSVPFEYYKKALDMASYKRVIICTDEPNDRFLQNFRPYNPIIHSTASLRDLERAGCSYYEISKRGFADFTYMMSFNKMILSYSTFAWWVGFLSDAQEVYMPYPDGTTNYYSYGKIEESRFRYIATRVGSR